MAQAEGSCLAHMTRDLSIQNVARNIEMGTLTLLLSDSWFRIKVLITR